MTLVWHYVHIHTYITYRYKVWHHYITTSTHTFTSTHIHIQHIGRTSMTSLCYNIYTHVHTHTYNITITVIVILIVFTVFTVALSLSEWFWCHILWWSISVHQTSLGFFYSHYLRDKIQCSYINGIFAKYLKMIIPYHKMFLLCLCLGV